MFWLPFIVAYAFKKKDERQPGQQTLSQVKSQHQENTTEEEGWIICRQCHQRLTRPSDQVRINGSHRHTFANPSGIVFEIGCFQSAPGCTFSGPPSYEFTWFSGYQWQISICNACLTHLGWRFFSDDGTSFFGLIIDRLTFPSRKS